MRSEIHNNSKYDFRKILFMYNSFIIFNVSDYIDLSEMLKRTLFKRCER